MAKSKIAKERLPELLAAVGEDYAIYGPMADAGIVGFGRVGSAEELMLTYRNSTVSPKELFLPKTETVYEFDGEKILDDALPEEKRVVFGMRPCDCRALRLLDLTFGEQKVKDPFYLARRANTLIVTLACDRPSSSCSCTAVGGDPYGEEGTDVLLSDAGDALLVKAVTDKGKEFLSHYDKFFSGGGAGDWSERAKDARKKINAGVKIEDVNSRLDDLFESEIWQRASRKCLGCGVCSYVCPTCYCFDLTDEKTSTGVRKVRRWDCCMFPSFTLHASGHNPRPVNAPRLRQKLMHKFCYHTQRYGLNSCVGCGRCVRSCPANLDIRQLLGELATAPSVAAEE